MLTFQLTQEQYDALAAKGHAAGVPISGDSGEASRMGNTVRWAYAAPVLNVTIVKTHWPENEQDITDKVTALVNSVKS
jgi:hypothetical protein